MSEDTIKKCNFCRLADELNTEEIPFWSKKNENYSPYPKMVNCDSNYSLKNEDLKDILPDLDENSLEAHLTLGDDNSDKHVFYWAANPQKDIHKILGPGEAYGEYENHGLLKCDDKGEVILKFNPPQPYKENSKTNPKHIHYLLESSDQTWLPLKTIRIIQSVSLEYLDERIKTKDMIILNALPEKYHKKDKIPSSYNLPTESLDKYTSESKCRKVKNFIKSILKYYPKIESLVNDKHLSLEDVPIVTYCAHSKCDASDKLIDHLYECKFNNTQEFKGGIEEYNKNRSFFPDSDIDDDEEDKDDGEDDGDDDDEEGVDYEEISDEEDDDYIDIIHQGIEYSYLDGILYDESLNPIGEATVKNGKIKSMSDECQKYHKRMKGDEEDVSDDVESERDPASEAVETEEEDKDEPESDESSDEDPYDEETINKLKGGKGTLKIILKNIASREKNSYTYGNIQNMKKDKLVEIALTCQGKRVCSKKSDYKYKTKDEIEIMTAKQLRELLNEMINREPGTFKYSESSWSRGKLIHFILTCQGSSKPSQIGRTSFVGGGWSL
tara:strand:+ start:2708 stop:4372 length:1665 start_codon:yes stop_codon:yes gene_type:complete